MVLSVTVIVPRISIEHATAAKTLFGDPCFIPGDGAVNNGESAMVDRATAAKEGRIAGDGAVNDGESAWIVAIVRTATSN
jgi:hypothetical protein